MKRILLTNKYAEIPDRILRHVLPIGFDLAMLEEVNQDNLTKSIIDAEYLLVSGRLRITREALDHASNLKMIQRTGVGLDALDLDAIKEKGIPLYVNQGVNAESVAEHALLLILSCLRKLPIIDKNTKNGVWKKQIQGTQTHELKGKIVGIIGMGNIARTLVSFLKPFDVKILYNDLARLPEQCELDNNMFFSDLDHILSESDIVTIHCALTSETRNLINAESIRKMKDGAILINTARGPIVNACDLASALKEGKLSFAGIDVHEEEPFPASYPLLGIENVILTPHIGGITYEAFYQMMHDAMRNIEYFDSGRLEEIKQYRYL